MIVDVLIDALHALKAQSPPHHLAVESATGSDNYGG